MRVPHTTYDQKVAGRLNPLPDGYPYPKYNQLTDEQVNWWTLRETYKAMEVKDRYLLSQWITINQLTNGAVSLEEWIGYSEWTHKWGLDPLMMRALLQAVDEVSQQIKQERQRQAMEAKSRMEGVKLPTPTINAPGISSYFR